MKSTVYLHRGGVERPEVGETQKKCLEYGGLFGREEW